MLSKVNLRYFVWTGECFNTNPNWQVSNVLCKFWLCLTWSMTPCQFRFTIKHELPKRVISWQHRIYIVLLHQLSGGHMSLWMDPWILKSSSRYSRLWTRQLTIYSHVHQSLYNQPQECQVYWITARTTSIWQACFSSVKAKERLLSVRVFHNKRVISQKKHFSISANVMLSAARNISIHCFFTYNLTIDPSKGQNETFITISMNLL